MRLALPFIGGFLALVLAYGVKHFARERLRRSNVSYRLRFPRGLKAEDVESFVGGLSGLLLSRWYRWAVTPAVVFDIRATHGGIEHFVSVPASWSRSIEKLLQAAVPSVRFEEIDPPKLHVLQASEYYLTDSQRQLRVDSATLPMKLLSSLQPLGHGETVCIQWIVSPHGPTVPARVESPSDHDRFLSSPDVLPTSEAVAARNAKHGHPLFLGVVRIGAAARSRGRCRTLIRQVAGVWHETRSPGTHLQKSPAGGKAVGGRLGLRLAPLIAWPGTYSSVELSGLIGWPIEAGAIPGVDIGGSRQVAASPLIPSTGTIVADSTFPGDERPLAMSADARRRPTWILGPTGSGKSELLGSMVIQDLEAGHGLVLVDPKGDLAQDVLQRIPKTRIDDVILLDPAVDNGPVVGLNPLRPGLGGSTEVAVENLTGLFRSLYRRSWGARTDDVLRAALLTLAQTGNAALTEVVPLLLNPDYRRSIVGKLDDPIGLESFWGWYNALSSAEQLAVVSPVLNKIRAFSMRPRVRAIIGQATPKLSMAEVMRDRKILIVSLATGLLGDEAAALLGALVVAELWHATTARAAIPQDKRHLVVGVFDEWSRFVHLPTPMATVLAEARGLGLGVVVANQQVSQIPDDAREALFANARSKIMFQLPAGDARLMARELGGVLTADDLQGLGPYEVAVQLYAAGSTQAAATARTRQMPPASSDPDLIRKSSAERYGVDRTEVEEAIRRRQLHHVAAPVGRRKSGEATR